MSLPAETNIPRGLKPHYIKEEGSTLFGIVGDNSLVYTG
jgi:hypothetical protein